MKVVTVVGTRPEIIRLAAVIKTLDRHCKHVLVHTGQNYDYTLNQVFFRDLELRAPDRVLDVRADTLHEQLGKIITQTGQVLADERPDALLVLGDTNSALCVINAKRMKIPIFHMEAGDRSFDENVPEELNRRIVDHTADVNLAYTEHSRRNLLREGVHPSRIFVVGSPVREVYQGMKEKFERARIVEDLGLTPGRFFTASIHREENVDRKGGLASVVASLNALCDRYGVPVIVSTHPRTRRRLEQQGLLAASHALINWHEPFGLIDFIALQTRALCVVSDSGTIHEDSSILDFPAIAIRRSTEKPESIDAGHCMITGLDPESVVRGVELVTTARVDPRRSPMPEAYAPLDVSGKVVRIVLGMAKVVDELVWGGADQKWV
ncbi:MAG: UDP-N-acetylglucosamine 2-epimerase (non-hydrolyzing) [Candidatus Rokubacteria bacterium]|nr:UDP-N-acetylglucosamine 2-epimerase (non-hydrolyzing) [Candidatus Rokubacteria bacterium]